MKHLSSLVGACLSAALLAACGGPGPLASQSGPSSALPAQRQAARIAPTGKTGPTLYVLNVKSGPDVIVTVYSNGGASFLRKIDLGSYYDLYGVGFAVDPLGRLYASAYQQGEAMLSIYGDRGAKLVRALHQTHAFASLTLDGSGNLYTMCAIERVCEYAKAKQHVIRRLKQTCCDLATDTNGDIAVAGTGGLRVFAPGQTEPYWEITSGVNDSLDSLAFDPPGNLYASNAGVSRSDLGSVAVYAPGDSAPVRTITNGIDRPLALTVDTTGNLYVLNVGSSSSVTVYAPGGSNPVRTITDGIVGSGLDGAGEGLALDGSGNLYVANGAIAQRSLGSVTVYAPGGTSPIRTVTQGIQNPVAIGIGP